MKNFTIVTLLILAMGPPSKILAQEYIEKGLKFGVNLSSFTGMDAEDASPKLSYALGGYVDFGLTSKFSVQLEALYSKKGATFDREFWVDNTIEYLDIPILAKISITRNIDVYAGSYIGIVLNARRYVRTTRESFEQVRNTTKPELGLIFGASYSIKRLTFETRFSYAITSVYIEQWGYHNLVAQIITGIKI